MKQNFSQNSPKSDGFLREGRLMTASSDSMCGVTLKVGKLYLIAGNSQRINICNSYAKEYSQLTIVERRGFAGGYKKGCACQVSERKPFIKRMHMSNLSNWIKKKQIFRDYSRLRPSSWCNIIKRLASANGHFPIVKPILALVFQLAVITHRAENQSNAIGATVNRTQRVSAKPNRINSSNNFKFIFSQLSI